MLFNSYTFLIFLGIVLLVSRQIGSWTARKFFLLIASYLFYAAWNPPFVLLLWISTLADWVFAKRIYASDARRPRALFLSASLAVNLGLLGYFKYGTLLLDTFTRLMQYLQIDFQPASPDIVLPVGISFYTFQTLSYTLDIYRGKTKPWHSFLDYALYVTFFPQLVAGPIVRAVRFLPQCVEEKKGTSEQIGWGLTLFVIGLFNKMVIADSLMAPIAERVFDGDKLPGFFQVWAGSLAFSVQIFCDFAGYSTCAIGIALCLGFVLPTNFKYPYAAMGFSDFWSRWHISLSTWFRDYLYIALGGNRRGTMRTFINLMLTMGLCGLWHGASWLLVLFGMLHGFYLVGERLVRQSFLAAYGFWHKTYGRVVLVLITFGLYNLAWPLFRGHSLEHAFDLTRSMIGLHRVSFQSEMWLYPEQYATVLLCTIGILVIHYIMRNRSLEEVFSRMPWALRGVFLAILMYLTLISFTGEDRAFIYFQF